MVGEVDIWITNDNSIHETTALVSSNVNYNLLVAWYALQFIVVLSKKNCMRLSNYEWFNLRFRFVYSNYRHRTLYIIYTTAPSPMNL